MPELSWKPEQSVQASVLGESAGGASQSQPARIVEFSGKRMRLAAGLAVKAGVAVRVEWDGQLLLGQVLNTEPGGFWIEIQHMLLDSSNQGWQKQGRQRA